LVLGACGGGAGVTQSNSGIGSSFSADASDSTVETTSSPAIVGFAWRITVDQVLVLPAGTAVTIATGAHGMIASVSPALPNGRTLSIAENGDLQIVSSAEAPEVEASGPWSIEVSSAT
jgi:hypothetical protein